jgi:hypothetical protein
LRSQAHRGSQVLRERRELEGQADLVVNQESVPGTAPAGAADADMGALAQSDLPDPPAPSAGPPVKASCALSRSSYPKNMVKQMTQLANPGEPVKKRMNNTMQLIRTAGFIIENVFEGDVAALASWKSASHVKTKKYPPPPPTPPTP